MHVPKVLISIVFLLLGADGPAKNAPPLPNPSLSISAPAEPDDPPVAPLGSVRRIYVDVFTGGEIAARMRELIIGALHRSKLFIITENEDRADAILRGAAKEEAFTDRFHSSDNANGRSQYGSSDGNGYGKSVYSRESRNVSSGLGESESVDIEERRHEATAAVRLVTPDGDVIWSTTQESLGAKFRSAGEDVAERVAKQLAADYQKDRPAHP